MIVRQCYERMSRPQSDACLVESLNLVSRDQSSIAIHSPVIGGNDDTSGPDTHVGGH